MKALCSSSFLDESTWKARFVLFDLARIVVTSVEKNASEARNASN